MHLSSERPLREVPTGKMAEIFDFCEEMLTNFDWDYYVDMLHLEDVSALRLNALSAVKIYSELGLVKEEDAEKMRLADVSDYSAVNNFDCLSSDILEDDCTRELWYEFLQCGDADSFDSSFLFPGREQGYRVFDYPCACGMEAVEAISEAKNEFGQMPEGVYEDLNELQEMCGEEDGGYEEVGWFRLTIISSSLVGAARNKADCSPSNEGELLKRILASRYLMTNYEVGQGYYDCVDPTTETWWLVLPNIYDSYGDCYLENNDTIQNQMFPLYLWMLSELSSRVLET